MRNTGVHLLLLICMSAQTQKVTRERTSAAIWGHCELAIEKRTMTEQKKKIQTLWPQNNSAQWLKVTNMSSGNKQLQWWSWVYHNSKHTALTAIQALQLRWEWHTGAVGELTTLLRRCRPSEIWGGFTLRQRCNVRYWGLCIHFTSKTALFSQENIDRRKKSDYIHSFAITDPFDWSLYTKWP